MKDSNRYPVSIDRRVFVEMTDGVRIALTTYLPDAPNDGPFPAIVESLPYRKDDDCTARDYSTYAYMASRGMAGVRIDIRGTGASTGIINDEYLPIEQSDNVEILAWLEHQDWCTGNIGMWGISWGGFSSLQTAMLRPPQLKAIAAMHATHDRFACDVHYVGGSLHAAEQVDWPPSMISSNALPPDPDIFGDGWYEEWIRRLEGTPQWPLEWLRHQNRDDYWMHGSPSAAYTAIECPTLLIGGWLDGYVDGMLDMATHLSCPTRTLIGPWGHHRPATGIPGPTYDHLDLMARWFGHHLRGDDNGVMDMAPVTAFIRTDPPYDDTEVSGYWRTESAWPPSDKAEWSTSLADLNGSGTTWNEPQWVGAHAPAWDRSGVTSTDSSQDDDASLTFTTEPFADPLEILGSPEVELSVTTDQPFGLVAVRLLIVDPDGIGHLICRGNRNLTFPLDLSSPQSPQPGRQMSIRFPLMATSSVVPSGSRLRLSISGADFPVVWPPPGRFTLGINPAKSRLVLPTVPVGRPDHRVEVAPFDQPPIPPVEFLVDEDTWMVAGELGETAFRRHVASRQFQADRDDLTYASDQSWEVTVSDVDPASTTVRSKSELTLSRPGWEVKTTGSLDIRGAGGFQVAIELTAMHNGTQIWQRSWHEDIPRVWA